MFQSDMHVAYADNAGIHHAPVRLRAGNLTAPHDVAGERGRHEKASIQTPAGMILHARQRSSAADPTGGGDFALSSWRASCSPPRQRFHTPQRIGAGFAMIATCSPPKLGGLTHPSERRSAHKIRACASQLQTWSPTTGTPVWGNSPARQVVTPGKTSQMLNQRQAIPLASPSQVSNLRPAEPCWIDTLNVTTVMRPCGFALHGFPSPHTISKSPH